MSISKSVSHFPRFALAALICLGSLATATAATPALPIVAPIFGDEMVLQRGKPNPIWGWAVPGTSIKVQLDHDSGSQPMSTVTAADGRWELRLTPPPVGSGEHTITIDGPEHRELQHVVVGDVWLCGGQSNMELGLPVVENGAAEVAAANHPEIRLFKVGSNAAYAPAQLIKGSWQKCSPASVAAGGGFSAVAYFFARKVHAETGIPIGLIEDCLGGTPIETWMDPLTIAARGDFGQPMAELDRLRATHAAPYGNYVMHWYDQYDPGIRGATWADPALDDKDWTSVDLPTGFKQLGLEKIPAVVWFRKEFELPTGGVTGDGEIDLGVVERMDTTYVNGHWVGASSWVDNPRVYRVPAKLLKPGRNVLVVRDFKVGSAAGFLTAPELLKLKIPGSPDLPLANGWKARLSVDARPPHPLPLGFENYPTIPTVLYLGMIRPIAPLALAGALWYQGEANAGRAYQYRSLLPEMIADWRKVFGQGDFPFYVVSLPAFQGRKAEPGVGSDGWAELREAQAKAAKSVAGCDVAVTIDTGEAGNIHPKKKQPVGERLALLALRDTYGRAVVAEGPTFVGVAPGAQPGELRVRFDHTEGGLIVRGTAGAGIEGGGGDGTGMSLGEFSVAGADRQWHWAEARIEGNEVVVSAPAVPQPVAVRYAWQANPKANLFNGAGLPAAPFRSDDWPGVTEKSKPW